MQKITSLYSARLILGHTYSAGFPHRDKLNRPFTKCLALTRAEYMNVQESAVQSITG